MDFILRFQSRTHSEDVPIIIPNDILMKFAIHFDRVVLRLALVRALSPRLTWSQDEAVDGRQRHVIPTWQTRFPEVHGRDAVGYLSAVDRDLHAALGLKDVDAFEGWGVEYHL